MLVAGRRSPGELVPLGHPAPAQRGKLCQVGRCHGAAHELHPDRLIPGCVGRLVVVEVDLARQVRAYVAGYRDEALNTLIPYHLYDSAPFSLVAVLLIQSFVDTLAVGVRVDRREARVVREKLIIYVGVSHLELHEHDCADGGQSLVLPEALFFSRCAKVSCLVGRQPRRRPLSSTARAFWGAERYVVWRLGPFLCPGPVPLADRGGASQLHIHSKPRHIVEASYACRTLSGAV